MNSTLTRKVSKINKEKCTFAVRALIFLGYKHSGEGISPSPERNKAIKRHVND